MLPLLTLLTGGCGRKAPGPAECETVARRWVEVESAYRLGPLSARPLSRDRLDVASVAHLCLTVPFDESMVRCVHQGTAPRQCLRALESRLQNRRPTE